MRKTYKQHAETPQRKISIIQAALDCFSEAGYFNTTMDDIRVRSGASNGSIYHFFKSKDQLATAVYIEGIRDYQNGLVAKLGALSAREGVYAIVRYHLEWVGANPRWAQYLFSMRHADFMRGSEDSIKYHNNEFYAALSSWFRKQVMSGMIRRLSPSLYMALIWGPCQEYARLWLAGKRGLKELESAAGVIGDAAWQSLKANSEVADIKQ